MKKIFARACACDLMIDDLAEAVLIVYNWDKTRDTLFLKSPMRQDCVKRAWT
jgi:hypothetical protein